MTTGNPKFVRRQKEIARTQQAKQKREERASRRKKGENADDGIAAIQAALDAGLNPGAPEERVDGDEEAEGEPEAEE